MNLSAEQKRRLLATAEELATELARGGATRSEWRHVIDVLYLVPGGSGRRLETAQELVSILPESWLADRSRQTERQLTQVRSTFRRVAREGYSTDELRFVLGWTTRLLAVSAKGQRGAERLQPRGRPGAGPKQPTRSRQTPSPKPHPVTPRPTPAAPRAPQREEWRNATVSFDAGGGGVVRAVGADRRTAEARQDAARTLLDSLSEQARTRLVGRRRPLRVDVDVEKVGASWRLVAIRDGGAGQG